MSSLQLSDVSKHFEKKVAVRNLNLELAEGEFLAVVGPSGCGKTTTLRLIAGLEKTSSGEIRLGERTVTDVRPRDRNIAMVFQDYAIFPHMTVYDNIAYGMRSRGEARSKIESRVPHAARTFRIEGLLKRKPKQLSGGERQRVALARALVRDAELYVYDEPLSNLDAQLRLSAREDILMLHRDKGKPSVYVTHDQSEAMALGDRIAVMKDGELMQIGSGSDLYERPHNLFVAFFIGTPSINLFDARLEAEGGDLYAVTDAFRLCLPADTARKVAVFQNRPLKLGLRPEAFHIPKQAAFSVSEGNTIHGLVTVIEPAASGSTVYLSTTANEPRDFIVKFDLRLPSRYLEQEIPLAIDPRKVQLFDPQTEDSLLHHA